jgi:glycosyltransferase involved in cell wall biosynthesis
MDENYSVIMPVKDAQKFICETLESIMKQTLAPTEVIIIDDGSTDSSIDIVKVNFPSARILRNDGVGQAAAMNLGIRSASCEYIAFLDADDLWAERKNENQIKYLARNMNVDAVCGSVINFAGNFSLEGEMEKYRFFEESRAFGASMIRRSAFKKYGFFDPNYVQFPFPWWSKAVDLGIRFDYLREPALYRRVHSDNNSKSKEVSRRAELLKLVREHKNRGQDLN